MATAKTRANDPMLQMLHVRIAGIKVRHENIVSVGDCADWSDYRRETGIIEGLAMAERELLELDDKTSED